MDQIWILSTRDDGPSDGEDAKDDASVKGNDGDGEEEEEEEDEDMIVVHRRVMTRLGMLDALWDASSANYHGITTRRLLTSMKMFTQTQ